MEKTLDYDLAVRVEARYKREYREIPAFQIVTNADWTLSRAIRGLDTRLRALEAQQAGRGGDSSDETGTDRGGGE